MIRINLLGLPKPKKGRRGRGLAEEPGTALSWPVMLLIFLVLVSAVNGYYYHRLNKQAEDYAARQKSADIEGEKYANTLRLYEQRKKEAEAYEKRVKVIDQLRTQQSGPAKLLAAIGATVDRTDAVWLANLTDDGANVNLEGTALSTHAVANLISNLKNSGYFKNVELKETFQDDRIKDYRAFNFTLICEKQKS